jgi:hypothetical protein
MSEQPVNSSSNDELESRLHNAARSFPYPPTPDIAAAVSQQMRQPARRTLRPRRLALAAAIILAILFALLSVPQVRAAVADILRIGAIIIHLTEPSPTPTTVGPTTTAQVTIIPLSILDLAGETTLEAARKKVNYSLRLPTYPPDLGLPDHVYLQQIDGPFVVMAWVDRQNPRKVKLSLHILGPYTNGYGEKGNPKLIAHTRVHGNEAAWLEGPHLLQYYVEHRVEIDLRRLVTGNVLVWEENGLTYRLETDLSMEEAVKIAESLQ